MNLSIITSTWNLPAERLNAVCWQLSHQSETPREIIVVNASPDADARYKNQVVCDQYPLVKCIDAPQDVKVFNLSRASNIGLKHTCEESEYVGVVALDLLYARNAIEALAECAEDKVMCEYPMGSLPQAYALGAIESVWGKWDSILNALHSNPPPYSFSPGSISCVKRDWLLSVRGYDEHRFSFSYGDSDLIHRAALCGIGIKIVPWNATQVIHIEHPARFGIQTSPPEAEDHSIERNGDRWGEI